MANNYDNDYFQGMFDEGYYDVKIDDINSLKIIINDCDCSDAFFQDVCIKLREDGLDINSTINCRDIDVDGSTVITLDQQYNSGTSSMVFAPFNNTRNGYSDSLALSMQTAFKSVGENVSKISCGMVGYSIDENGNVSSYSPTKTESKIAELSDVSFVTISLGTECKDPTVVAAIIENGLARQVNYLNNYDNNSDLVYRASEFDSIDDVSKYFSSDPYKLMKINGIKDATFHNSQAIINPNVVNMSIFNNNYRVNIEKSNEKTY